MSLPRTFYERPTLVCARDLLGMHLCHHLPGGPSLSGKIVEVEAYCGPGDRASHARLRKDGSPAPRATLMFGRAGVSYVYLIYGMHHCMNVVAHEEGAVGAVLIRALEPGPGLPPQSCRGPARLCATLGIDLRHKGLDLCPSAQGLAPVLTLTIEDRGTGVRDEDVVRTTRIGVAYAAEDALLPYRFCDRRSALLSRRP